MALKTYDVLPMCDWAFRKFVDLDGDDLDRKNRIFSNPVIVKTGPSISIRGEWGSQEFHPGWVPTLEVGNDHLVCVSICLAVRELCSALVALAAGTPVKNSPSDAFMAFRYAVINFASGGAFGGAERVKGVWFLSRSWTMLGRRFENPTTNRADMLSDPNVLALSRLYQTDSLSVENRFKAISCCFDPMYRSDRVKFTARVSISPIDYSTRSGDFEGWAPTLHMLAGDSPDVTKRPGTWSPRNDLSWAGAALEDCLTDGYVWASLQQPRILSMPGLHERLAFTEDGECWFRRKDQDLRIEGLDADQVALLAVDREACRLRWLASVIAVALPYGVTTAVQASPLSFCAGEVEVKADFTSQRSFTMNSQLRSDLENSLVDNHHRVVQWCVNQPDGTKVSAMWLNGLAQKELTIGH